MRVTEREQPEHRLVLRSELCSRAPKEATYGANVEEYRKWYQGISKSVKEVQIVGSPRSSESPQTDAEAANEAMTRLREQQEAQIIVTTTDGNKKPKQAITSLTISLGNGLHLTRKGMSFDEFLTFAQNLKALC